MLMDYIQVSLGEFGWRHGYSWRHCSFTRPKFDDVREGVWYPVWHLWLGPLIVRRLRMQPFAS
jgi:hypothetical protein